MVEFKRAFPAQMTALAAAQPENPFATNAYAQATAGSGSAWLAMFKGDDPAGWALAVIDAGRIRKHITIASLPAITLSDRTVGEIERAAASIGATSIGINTFCSPPGSRIELADPARIAHRFEYRWDMAPDDLYAGMSKSHRERARQAERKGVTVHRSTDRTLLAHVNRLHASSIARRQRRGESVASRELRIGEALIASGAGEIFHAVFEGAVVAAVLTITSARAAYTMYSGNAPDGLKLGASHLLRVKMAEMLREAGIGTVVLGGASEDQEGLRDFKRRFGTEEVALSSLTLDCASGWRRFGDRLLRAVHGRNAGPANSPEAS